MGEAVGDRVLGEQTFESRTRLRADVRVDRRARRYRKFRQVVLAEAQFEIAASGDLNTVRDRLGDVGEQRDHLFGRFQVLFGRVVARALRIGQQAARMDAYTRLVRLEILAREKAHVVARDDGAVARRGKLQRAVDEMRFVGVAGAREFEIPAVVEMLEPRARQRERGFVFVGEHELADIALAPGKRYQARAATLEPFRLQECEVAMTAFEIAARDEFREIEIARAGLTQHGQAERLVRVARIGNPQIRTGDRLDPVRLGRAIKLDQREQIALIGQRECRMTRLDRATDQIRACARLGRIAVFGLVRQTDGRIDERIIAVDVQVGEAGHLAAILAACAHLQTHRAIRHTVLSTSSVPFTANHLPPTDARSTAALDRRGSRTARVSSSGMVELAARH